MRKLRCIFWILTVFGKISQKDLTFRCLRLMNRFTYLSVLNALDAFDII